MKKMLSMILSFCLVVTLLPTTVMAEKADATIGTSIEIINFASLEETEKTVAIGTSVEDLALPEMLSATVRAKTTSEDESVQGTVEPDKGVADDDASADDEALPEGDEAAPEGDESATLVCDIPVTWTSDPTYDGDTEGIYVFTPVVDYGYTLAEQAELPQITVTVGAPAVMALFTPLTNTEYEVWVDGVQVTSANKDDVLEDGTVRYTPAEGSKAQMLTLNGATITNAYESDDYKSGIYANGQLQIVLADGTINTVTGVSNSGKTSCGIYTTGLLSFSGDG